MRQIICGAPGGIGPSDPCKIVRRNNTLIGVQLNTHSDGNKYLCRVSRYGMGIGRKEAH